MTEAASVSPEAPADAPRWGLGDVTVGWFVVQVVAQVWGLGVLLALGRVDDDFDDLPLGVVALVQLGLALGFFAVPYVVTRAKGNGLVIDVGLRARWPDAWRGGLAGVALQVAVLPLVYWPLLELLDRTNRDLEGPARSLGDRADTIVGVAALVLIVGVLAPIFEEIFYRGFLQRALLKRGLPPVAAIAITSVVFGATHFLLLQLPGLILAGALFGILAYRSGRLGPAIAAHVSFNMVTVVALVVSLTEPAPPEDATMTADMARDTTTEAEGDVLVREDAELGRAEPDRDGDESSEWDGWAVDLDGDDDDPPEDPVARAQRHRFVRLTVDWVVVTACAVFVFANLHPDQILSSAVPAGGDMGAHVWGPAFLRDHLLPAGRISGWTPDWYAGFPAYQFYMVVPSLLIVALDVGLFGGWTLLLPLGAAAGLVYASRRVGAGPRRWALVALAAVVALGGAELPYGTAFKLVTVLGLLSLPVAAYAFGRLADLPFPGPALLAVAAVLFLFDRNFTIYGGNVASTLAGEFAFSISLSLALVYMGVVMRGLRTGRHRALAAVLLALTGLCHLIPAFFALIATVVIALARRPALRTVKWLAAVLPVGGLLSAFWVLPFAYQSDYVNDMGWKKLPEATAANGFRSWSDTLFSFNGETYWKYLVPRSGVDSPNDLRWILALACMGLVLSIAFKVRTGLILTVCTLVMAAAFVGLPQGRLWNARLLPFYYLCLYLLAAVGVAEVGRTLAVLVARDPDRPSVVGPALTAAVGLLAGLVVVGMPLRTLPFGEERADGSYGWMGLTNAVNDGSFVRSWARWNYSGYEGKDAYAEYRDLMVTMEEVGAEHGCGRSLWEYDKGTDRYGTPMALMLLPHWTDGCIGSMEGLFFEASATTPFHFLTQVELSTAPSAAQRDLPYGGFDIDKGVRHLQLMGVRYYLSTSPQATTAARRHEDLEELTTSGPWVIFQVADSDLVEGLDNEPAVLEGVDDAQHDWICRTKDDNDRCAGPAVAWYQDLDVQDVFLASSGPEDWQRVDTDEPEPEERSLEAAEVTNLEVGNDRIAFDIDEPGRPVLVKSSYFPNWQASGADGPYRVAPNLMVVVPRSEHVELTYGREPIEWVAYGLTGLGMVLVVLLATRRPIQGRHTAEGPDGDGPSDPDGPDEDRSAEGSLVPPSPRHLAR